MKIGQEKFEKKIVQKTVNLSWRQNSNSISYPVCVHSSAYILYGKWAK